MAGQNCQLSSLLAVLCCVISLTNANVVEVPKFPFKEYSYVALPKYETYFQEFQSACEQSPSCYHFPTDGSVERINCIRECISPSCYIELYQTDKLEPGEIDVRLDSFKGCFIQRRFRN